jgi:hypothetical protein
MKSENIYDYIVRSNQEWQPLIEGGIQEFQ